MKRLLLFLLLVALLPMGAAGAADTALPVDGQLPLYVEEIPATLDLAPTENMVIRIRNMRRMANDYTRINMLRIKNQVSQYNAVLDGIRPHIPTYMYFAENSRSHPLAMTFPENSAVYDYLRENLHVDHCDHLKYTTFAQYCQYFYTTDHHWNFRGSYQAYLDVVRMLKGEKEPVLAPVGIHVTPAIFNGSYSKNTNQYISQEPFALYRFDPYPTYTALVEGKKKRYDRIDMYLEDRVNTKKAANHYALCYGGDYGMVVFQGNHPGKGTLLILGDSLSNAVKLLLIQHYDTIISIDIRYYEENLGQHFSMRKVLREYPVDQILFLGDTSLYLTEKQMRP